MALVSPSPATTSSRWAVIGSRFHEVVVDGLVEGAFACFEGHGVPRSAVRLVRVSGAWELPQAAAALARGSAQERPMGLVVVGAVVRGETPHFDALVEQVSAGLMRVALDSGLAVGFGLLTCETLEQAVARAGGDRGNKGFEAAEAAWDLSLTLTAGAAHGG